MSCEIKNEQIELDVAIVGGGIVSLWIAFSILKRWPNLNLAIFEKEKFILEHTSGRNSEVLHAGIYYPNGSNKHLLCLEGNRLWREFINQNQLEFLDCGKFIVSNYDQKEQLEVLYQNAHDNGVNVRWAKTDEICSSRGVVNFSHSFYSPTSGVLNVSLAAKFLLQKIEALGGIVLYSTEVQKINHYGNDYLIELSDHTSVNTKYLINAAGLWSTNIRTMLGLNDLVSFYVKGSYLTLSKKLPLKNLIYPIPPENKLGLGVHLTLDVGLNQKFGPNTEIIQDVSYSVQNNLIDQMYPEINKIFPTVKSSDLILGYAGIRPKIRQLDESIVNDFIIQSPIKNYIELLGIESPGLTAAPAIGKYVTSLL